MKLKLDEFFPLWPAEQTLRDKLHSGKTVAISEQAPESDAADGQRLRSSFIRYIACGGCDDLRPSAKGLYLSHAYIQCDETDNSGQPILDLEGAELLGDFGLWDCFIAGRLLMRGARARSVFLNRSNFVDGINADRVQTRGDFQIQKAHISGALRASGASIRGSFDCTGSDMIFKQGDGYALKLDWSEVGRSVRLGKNASYSGGINLVGARIAGDLRCTDISIDAKSKALNLSKIRVGGIFYLDGTSDINGSVHLVAADISALEDSLSCWPQQGGSIALNRCRYDALLGSEMNVADRLKWLRRQDPTKFGERFWPQPYEQLAKVFNDMGHRQDAKKVLYQKEKLQRRDRRSALRQRRDSPKTVQNWVNDLFMRAFVGYGQYPLRAVWWLILFWLIGVGVFHTAQDNAALKPNSAYVLRADEWVGCAPADDTQPPQYTCFINTPKAASYPTFNPWVYSADTLLPIVDLEMQTFWIPDETHDFGAKARYFLWFHIATGWFLSLLAVAGFSGLVKSD